MVLVFFPQVWRLTLVARVSSEAFRANFITSDGKSCTALTHSSAAFPSNHLAMSPWTGRLQSCSLLSSASSVARNALARPLCVFGGS